jgi:hypothetical protein
MKRKEDSDKGFDVTLSEPVEKVNKVMEKLRARLYTLAESSLPVEQQALSFKKAIKDYTSETWNEITKVIEELEKEEK